MRCFESAELEWRESLHKNMATARGTRIRGPSFRGPNAMHETNDTIELIETGLDDLQAEMEAGSRHMIRAREELKALDERIAPVVAKRERMGDLKERLADILGSMRQQRALVRDLRTEVRRLRNRITQNGR
jgi:chromosome segregation ATPase